MTIKKQKPYKERTDLEKIESNWAKTRGLISRKDKNEYSAAITRAATAVELAANFVIRKELMESRGLEREFVDSLLVWANGIQGKMDKLILPYFKAKDENRYTLFNQMRSRIDHLNRKRNRVVHSGEFTNEETARNMIKEAYEFVTTLVRAYEPSFKLKEIV